MQNDIDNRTISQQEELQVFGQHFLAATEVEATIGNITFYRMFGKYYCRSKSTLTGDRVRKDKRFVRTRHNGHIVAQAARLVSPVYQTLTEDWRCHDLYRLLVGVAVKLLHAGATGNAIEQGLHDALYSWGYRTAWDEEGLPSNLKAWVKEEIKTDGKREKGMDPAKQVYRSKPGYYQIRHSFNRIDKYPLASFAIDHQAVLSG